jgi:hypothetical protein
VIGTLTGGSVFGEISVLTNTRCQASIKTTSKCVLLSVERKLFKEVWCSIPDFQAESLLRIFGASCRFEHVLNYSVTRKEFIDFTATEHCSENINFLEKTLDFKIQFMSRTVEENTECAVKIMNMYVGSDTPLQVNLPEALVAKCEVIMGTSCSSSSDQASYGLFKNRCPPITFFDECNEEIYRILDMGAFLRYKKSPSFLSLLRLIRAYNGVDLTCIEQGNEYGALDPLKSQLLGENLFADPSDCL